MKEEYQAFCVKCKKKVSILNLEFTELSVRGGVRKAVKGKCSKCGTKVYAIIKNEK